MNRYIYKSYRNGSEESSYTFKSELALLELKNNLISKNTYKFDNETNNSFDYVYKNDLNSKWVYSIELLDIKEYEFISGDFDSFLALAVYNKPDKDRDYNFKYK